MIIFIRSLSRWFFNMCYIRVLKILTVCPAPSWFDIPLIVGVALACFNWLAAHTFFRCANLRHRLFTFIYLIVLHDFYFSLWFYIQSLIIVPVFSWVASLHFLIWIVICCFDLISLFDLWLFLHLFEIRLVGKASKTLLVFTCLCKESFLLIRFVRELQPSLTQCSI